MNSITTLQLAPEIQIDVFDSGSLLPTYRAELPDGRHFQLNEQLYHLLECLRSPIKSSDVYTSFQQRTDETIPEEDVTQICQQLTKQGLLSVDGRPVAETAKPEKQKSFLELHWKRDIFSPEQLHPITNRLQYLFTRPVAVLGLAVALLVHVMAFRELGFPPRLEMTSISWPILYAIMLITTFIHELGHLSACRRWACPHGAMGFGLYFFSPVFFADVTSTWRLKRWQRIVVDLGGIYLELLSIPILWVLFLLTDDYTYLMAIVATDMVILSNLEPFMKLDGYWLLSDAGIPNLHLRMMDIIKQSWCWFGWRCGLYQNPPAEIPFSTWKPWVRTLLMTYVTLSVAIWPVILIAMFPMLVDAITTYPALWKESLLIAVEAVRFGDGSLLWSQLGVLFLPTMAIANATVLGIMVVRRFRQRNQDS